MQEIQAEGFTICGKEVVVFLGGDFHFLDDSVGHQGSSATYPSSIDKVLLQHLQNHGNAPHTPESCPTEIRTIQDYHKSYNENLADERYNNNMNENGKFHNSVIGPMIFPIQSMDNIIPASMHINLGVVLLLYNLLLEKCKEIDKQGADVLAHVCDQLEQEWELASLTLDECQKKLYEHGQNVVIMTNRMNRHDFVKNGDQKENICLSKVSEMTPDESQRSKG